MNFVPCSRAFPAIPDSLPKHGMTLEASLFTISKLQTAINGKSISGDVHGLPVCSEATHPWSRADVAAHMASSEICKGNCSDGRWPLGHREGCDEESLPEEPRHRCPAPAERGAGDTDLPPLCPSLPSSL